jgi:hypothetical protein
MPAGPSTSWLDGGGLPMPAAGMERADNGSRPAAAHRPAGAYRAVALGSRPFSADLRLGGLPPVFIVRHARAVL